MVLTGNIKVWYPLSSFMRSADPNWKLDDPIIPGSYPIYNCVGDFDPDSGLGAGSNYGDGFEPGYGEVDYDPEPSGNNCRYHNFQIAEPGSLIVRTSLVAGACKRPSNWARSSSREKSRPRRCPGEN